MTPPQAWPFFALVRDERDPVRLIKMERPVQTALTARFTGAAVAMLTADLDRVPLTASYRPDEGEIFAIQQFPLPERILTAIEDPRSCDDLKLNEHRPDIRGIFTGTLSPVPQAIFQVFQKNQYLTARGFTLIAAPDAFRRLEDDGITITESVHAVYDAGDLIFPSYYDTRRIFDLQNYYRLATDSDLKTFSALPAVHFRDSASLDQNADQWVRRKIAIILDSGVLAQSSPSDISSAASEFGVQISVAREGDSDTLVFPDDKKALKNVLKFLDEDYYQGPLTRTRFISNSKRRAQTSGS